VRVAVIGANGQLGADLVEAFSSKAAPLTHEDVDVVEFESLKVLGEIDPDVVINTAAYHKTDECEENPEKSFQVNAVGALNVARACNEVGAINVYISTDYVFDGAKGVPYEEGDVPNPINVYGLSKYAGELFTRNYSEKYYIIRVASLYGRAGARGKGGNFVDFMVQRAKDGEELRVVDDVFMSPTYTKDVSRMLKRFLELKPAYGMYHMVNEGYCSWHEFTREIFDILGWDAQITPIKSDELKRSARRPAFSVLENRRLHEIGLKMRSWRLALREYLIEKGWMAEEKA